MENRAPESEDEMLAKIRDEGTALPEADKKLGQKKVLQISVVAVGALFLLGAVWLFAAPSGDKKSEKVAAANRGLSSAEEMRKEKELFGQAERTALAQAMPRTDSKVPGLASPAMAEPATDPKDFSDMQPAEPTQGIPVRKSKGAFPTSGGSAGNVRQAAEYVLPRELEVRLSENYQKAMAFYGSEQVVYSRAVNPQAPGPNPLGGVDSALQNLTDRSAYAGGRKIVISAGTELTASLNEALNTDYPSVVKATISSPPELAGAIALLSYSLGNERAAAQVGKIVLPARSALVKAKEITVASVVKAGLPGLGGDVNHHWGPQIAAGVANAGLTAGALAYAANQSSSDNLGTAVLLAPVIQQGVEGVLKPINYLGRDRPITVTVPAGTEFTILVTDGFEVTP